LRDSAAILLAANSSGKPAKDNFLVVHSCRVLARFGPISYCKAVRGANRAASAAKAESFARNAKDPLNLIQVMLA
jgi:hypothetical protein